ncbi:LysR family transcriptional regulator [Ruegeria lacuscaerulensis]|uniref:LysR family transcriptional regulator n=1 Tax=Ruegeria lacuscaerulensis TaxID=55218 RepID=UPI00147D6FFC|nr:LysR family transcriptional regulator [Ruegeria lacuscaerulensis]
MNWDNLKVLLAIGRAGSLTGAAHALDVDATTMGRRLTALEKELGVILFVRSKSGFVPTEAGVIAIRQAEQIEAHYHQMTDQISQSQASAVGVMRLVGNSWTMQRLAMTGMDRFLATNPGLDLRLMTRAPSARVSGEASIQMWFEVPPEAAEYTVTLGQVPYAVYRAAHLDTPPANWVAFFDEEASRPIISRAVERLSKSTETMRVTATDASVLVSAVAAGVGKGLLPMCLAKGRNDLVRVGTGRPEFNRSLNLYLNPDTVGYKRVQVTVEWLRAAFSDAFGPSG